MYDINATEIKTRQHFVTRECAPSNWRKMNKKKVKKHKIEANR